MTERISEITQKWFLCEDALFLTFCTHKVMENKSMKCPIRVGKGVIEFNPDLCSDMSTTLLEEYLRVEVIRILLKHPYERQPTGCCQQARAIGSNCVIKDAYPSLNTDIEHPFQFNLPSNGHYEFYARQIQRIMQKNNSINANGENQDADNEKKNSESNSDLAKNWEQDDLMAASINDAIGQIKSWGTIPNNVVEKIVASTKARINYRDVLAGFRASILSQKRKLTRMRPNRRSGFEAMGSRYDFTTRMIIGVDVSGSIMNEDLQNFYSTINRFFLYGIQQIDVIQFDTQIGEVTTFTKASQDINVEGRGGTNFQPFIDFVAKHPEYDGAIIYTDGYANQPTIPATIHTPLCWVLRSEEEQRRHESWMKQCGRVCVIENVSIKSNQNNEIDF